MRKGRRRAIASNLTPPWVGGADFECLLHADGVMGQWSACAVAANSAAVCYAQKKRRGVQRCEARGAFRLPRGQKGKNMGAGFLGLTLNFIVQHLRLRGTSLSPLLPRPTNA